MRPAGQILVAAAARFYAPLLVLFSLSLFAGQHATGGMEFAAGLLFAFAPLLHALTFGAVAARAAFPPLVARLLLAGGMLAVLAGQYAGAAGAALTQAGGFVVVGAAAVLIMTVLIGRAPTLPDADW